MLSFFPRDVLDEIWDLIESVSGVSYLLFNIIHGFNMIHKNSLAKLYVFLASLISLVSTSVIFVTLKFSLPLKYCVLVCFSCVPPFVLYASQI